MYAIKKFKDKGYTLKAQDNKIIFEDIAGCRYIFDLTNKKVLSNVIMCSEEKEYSNLINQMKKELGWNNEV